MAGDQVDVVHQAGYVGKNVVVDALQEVAIAPPVGVVDVAGTEREDGAGEGEAVQYVLHGVNVRGCDLLAESAGEGCFLVQILSRVTHFGRGAQVQRWFFRGGGL